MKHWRRSCQRKNLKSVGKDSHCAANLQDETESEREARLPQRCKLLFACGIIANVLWLSSLPAMSLTSLPLLPGEVPSTSWLSLSLCTYGSCAGGHGRCLLTTAVAMPHPKLSISWHSFLACGSYCRPTPSGPQRANVEDVPVRAEYSTHTYS